MNLALFLLLMFSGLHAQAQDRSPLPGSPNQQNLEDLVTKKNYLEQSAFIQITPRGMSFFQDNIYNLLQNQGSFEFEENIFPAQDPLALPPLTTEELLRGDKDKLALVQMLRNFLGQWTQGLTLASPHRFVIEIGNSGYQTRFTKFSLVADETLLQALHLKEGLIFAVELEAEKLIFFADHLKASDTSNPFLQRVGLAQPQFLIAGTKENPKIKLRIPFHVVLNSEGGLNFSTLQPQENIQSLQIDLKYQKLVTGQFQIVSRDENGKNEKIVKISTASLAQILNDNKAPLLNEMKIQIADFINKKLPNLLNEKFKEFSQKKLAFFDTIQPANVPANETKPPFIMGHKITGLKQSNGLNLWLASLIEDPTNPQILPVAGDGAMLPPSLNLLPTSQVDAIMVINQGLINRFLQLSFARGYFSAIKSKSCVDNSESTLSLSQRPIFRPFPDKKSNDPQVSFAMMETEVEAPVPKDSSSVFKRDKMRFKMSTLVRIQKMKDKACEIEVVKKVCAKGSVPGKPCKVVAEKSKVADPELTCLEIIKDETIRSSVSIDNSQLSFLGKIAEGFGKVSKGIAENLQAMDQACVKSKTKSVLADNILIPPMVFGMKFDIAKLNVDKNGQLVMYLVYKPAATKN